MSTHGMFEVQLKPQPHSGTMTRCTQQLTISVAPESGTDGLLGLAGTMTFKIADGIHPYNFAYTPLKIEEV